MAHILYCEKCNIFTLKEFCPECNNRTIPPLPPKYSPEDPYGDYRRKAKKQEWEEKGLL